MSKTDWIVMKEPDSAHCERCGESEIIPLPLSIPAFGKWVAYFIEKHKRCEAKG